MTAPYPGELHPIDICHTCHVSHYANEMRHEYTEDFSGLSPTGYVLTLTCRACDAGRSEHHVLPPGVRDENKTHSPGVFRIIQGGKLT